MSAGLSIPVAPEIRLEHADDARQATLALERVVGAVLLTPDGLAPGEAEAWREVERHAIGLRRALLRTIDRLTAAPATQA